jgi:membrane protease YdiL (CAAX protease family)
MIAANLVFGVCHALTPTYFLIATIFGFYFSALAQFYGPRNLLLPIVAHVVYDLIGFLLIARLYRQRHASERPSGTNTA